ncbi:putative lin-9 [Planoprotostelium fungivorum]|uniref:Putative lin-9 n=1 Tax=Planoprotostelium fungivorum TaxID=1890364 RepID=A0A2P6N3D5_9EUKA|nr:putative lin-9 [Planoprotostelium fungivorum]
MQSPSTRKSTRNASRKTNEDVNNNSRWSREELVTFFQGWKTFTSQYFKYVGIEGTPLSGRTPAMAETLVAANRSYLNDKNCTLEGFVGVMEDFYHKMALMMPNVSEAPKPQKSTPKSAAKRAKRKEKDEDSPPENKKEKTVKRQLFPSPKRQKVDRSKKVISKDNIAATESIMPPKMRDKNMRKETYQEDRLQIIEQQPSTEALEGAARLDRALRSPNFRKWCTYEFFYPTIDRGYFNHNEFQESLNELDLGKVTRVTRKEWSYFRDRMGKPRRFSEAFLKEEREQLEQYRNRIRQLRVNPNDVQSNSVTIREIPPQLSEGNSVVVDYEGGIHRGTVVTIVSPSSYLVYIPTLNVEMTVPDEQVMSCEIEFRNYNIPTSPEAIPDDPVGGAEDVQVNSTPTTATSHGTARVEHVVEYLKLAKMKCILVDELSAMNQLAEDVALRDEDYSAEFRRDYAYVVYTLGQTNRQIDAVSSKMYKSVTPEYGASRAINDLPSATLQPWLRDISPKCKKTARRVVNGRTRRYEEEVEEGAEETSGEEGQTGEGADVSVTNCLSLLLHLAECADAELNTVDMNFAIETALASCRPRHDANIPAFLEIQKEVRAIQTEYLTKRRL